jgi:hypothetical protein
MSEARLPLAYRDSCAGLLIPLNRCRYEEYYLPWKCEVSFSLPPSSLLALSCHEPDPAQGRASGVTADMESDVRDGFDGLHG